MNPLASLPVCRLQISEDYEQKKEVDDAYYVPPSQIFIDEGCTTYPDLEKSDADDVQAALNTLEYCRSRGPPFVRVNSRSQRMERLGLTWL